MKRNIEEKNKMISTSKTYKYRNVQVYVIRDDRLIKYMKI